MARARRQPSESQSNEFTCPECGRTFTRAAALGAHRRRAHGVVGATAQARARTTGRARAATTRAARQVATTAGTAANGRRTGRGRSRAAESQLDRDALLQIVFPAGVPAREAVI